MRGRAWSGSVVIEAEDGRSGRKEGRREGRRGGGGGEGRESELDEAEGPSGEEKLRGRAVGWRLFGTTPRRKTGRGE